jgi:hypothetical protein
MTPEESRSNYLSTVFSMDEVLHLEKLGLAQEYTAGKISISEIYKQLKDQGV